MENTKIYIVNANCGFSSGFSPKEFYLDKLSAEFRVWTLNKKETTSLYSPFSPLYSVSEINSGEFLDKKGKEYLKFIKEKENEIKKAIEEKAKCKEKDEKSIKELEEQLKDFQKVNNA